MGTIFALTNAALGAGYFELTFYEIGKTLGRTTGAGFWMTAKHP